MAKREFLDTIRDSYRNSSKKDKSRILDAFIAVTGHYRKHGIKSSADCSEEYHQLKPGLYAQPRRRLVGRSQSSTSMVVSQGVNGLLSASAECFLASL